MTEPAGDDPVRPDRIKNRATFVDQALAAGERPRKPQFRACSNYRDVLRRAGAGMLRRRGIFVLIFCAEGACFLGRFVRRDMLLRVPVPGIKICSLT